MRCKYFALLTLTVTSTLFSCTSGPYTPKRYFSLYTYRDYQRHNFMNGGAAPTQGDSKILVIPIWFTDSADYIRENKKEGVRTDIEKAFFGTTEETGWHSVSSYYKEDSFGHVNISGVCAPWYECERPSTDFYNADYMEELLTSAVKWYKSYSGESKLTDFDADGDGFIDGVAYIYAAPDSSNLPGKNAGNLWGYTTWFTGTYPSRTNPSLKNIFWASYDFLYDYDTAIDRAGTPANRGDNYQATIDAHCYIHEWGHNFGLPDYYDYDYINSFAGGFSMQDSNVGAHDPYSRYSLGWVDPYIPTQNCTIELKKIEQSGECILLAPEFTKSCFDEFVMIEYYSPEGLNELDTYHSYLGRYPSGLTEPGIRIWHIDSRLMKYNSRGYPQGITNDPTKSYVIPATSNDTTYEYGIDNDYHTLTLIRNDPEATYEFAPEVISEELFYEGDFFSLNAFQYQFKNNDKLNNNKKFTWKVLIEELNEEYATIKLTK